MSRGRPHETSSAGFLWAGASAPEPPLQEGWELGGKGCPRGCSGEICRFRRKAACAQIQPETGEEAAGTKPVGAVKGLSV